MSPINYWLGLAALVVVFETMVIIRLIVSFERERARHNNTGLAVEQRDRWLAESAVHLAAARRRGYPLLPFVNGLVDRYLHYCPRMPGHRHRPWPHRPNCEGCGLDLSQLPPEANNG